MRMLLHARFPAEPFNTLARKGEAGKILQRIVEDLKPEAAYFTEEQGQRSALLVVDLSSSSDVPRFAEPFFLSFNADCHFKVVMTPADLQAANLDALGKKWG
ncbi:MAG: hypothetical protein R3D01_02805 [Hyphomicrobiales bacterium]